MVSFTVSYEPVSTFGSVDSSQNGLEFFIDGIPQDLPFTFKENTPSTKSFTIPRGTHKLLWIYSQQAGAPGIVTLSEVTLTGTTKGHRAQQMVCPAGSYDPGSHICITCAPGSYSAEKATICPPCPPGTVSRVGATFCEPCGAGTKSEKISVDLTVYSK